MRLLPPTDATMILRELVSELDQYGLEDSTTKIMDRAKLVLSRYAVTKERKKHPNTLSGDVIASIRQDTGSLRAIAKRHNVSCEVVRKYRQR